jgi:hypothetical protein
MMHDAGDLCEEGTYLSGVRVGQEVCGFLGHRWYVRLPGQRRVYLEGGIVGRGAQDLELVQPGLGEWAALSVKRLDRVVGLEQ